MSTTRRKRHGAALSVLAFAGFAGGLQAACGPSGTWQSALLERVDGAAGSGGSDAGVDLRSDARPADGPGGSGGSTPGPDAAAGASGGAPGLDAAAGASGGAPGLDAAAGASGPDAAGPDAAVTPPSDTAPLKQDTTPPPGQDTAAPDPLASGLVAHWRFEDGPGSGVATDVTPNRNNGTLVGANNDTDWVTGENGRGRALSLSGSSRVEIPDSASLDQLSDAVTVAAWVNKPANRPGHAMIVSRQTGNTNGERFGFGFFDDRLFFLGDSIGRVEHTVATPNNQWVHVAGTFDGATLRLFIDGAQVTSLAHGGSIGADSTKTLIGANQNGGSTGETYAGRVDELRIYKRVLSPSEMAQLARP